MKTLSRWTILAWSFVEIAAAEQLFEAHNEKRWQVNSPGSQTISAPFDNWVNNQGSSWPVHTESSQPVRSPFNHMRAHPKFDDFRI